MFWIYSSFRETFFQIVKEQCSNHFKANIDKILGHLSKSGSVVDDNVRSLFFGDYMQAEGGKAYDEVTDLKELTSTMEKYALFLFQNSTQLHSQNIYVRMFHFIALLMLSIIHSIFKLIFKICMKTK